MFYDYPDDYDELIREEHLNFRKKLIILDGENSESLHDDDLFILIEAIQWSTVLETVYLY